ncbi:unnamed protein product (macronuclear) [Paramecium tetraurelia]|uniref:NmrA-like domain-containing protein n=1 Tax=Paramecium tetraurelia TaxID=5888 RepID=A0DU92_PARTE|nr:uncharacterized protein GSPATT00020281001 [Paramecium tetraurelia]CAK86609.1 unnamed protein product [Paramecium tetraurelia]|eukprot:XP_001454006.1 hypothetical protein (macronuclear) [Paramecium tetraurelia strain d4-2]
MSLLILNASNRIAQGFLKVAAESGKYEKIICADIFPTYFTVQRLLKFKQQFSTKIELFKVGDRQDLHDVIKQANNLLYVSHDYYQVTASKKNLLVASLDLVKTRNYKTAAYVAPVEHDHQEEIDEWKHLEVEGRRSIPQLVGIRSDITFGPQSTFTNQIAQRIQNNQSIYIKSTGQSCAPIFTGDLEAIVARVLAGDHAGKLLLAKGHKHIDFNSIIHLIEQSVNHRAQTNSSFIEKIIHPTNNCIIGQQLYCPSYINLTKLIANYKALENTGYDQVVGDNLVDIQEYHNKNTTVVDQSLKTDYELSYLIG